MAGGARPRPAPSLLAGHSWFVARATFSPDNRVLAVTCTTVALWDVEKESVLFAIGGMEGKGRREPLRPECAYDFFAFSRDARRLAVSAPPDEGDGAHRVHFSNIRRKERIGDDKSRHASTSPDGNLLAIGGQLQTRFGTNYLPSTVRLYHAPTFEEIDRAAAGR